MRITHKMLEDHAKWTVDNSRGKRLVLEYAYAQDTDLRAVNLRNARLPDANFTDANLQGTDFSGADLRSANFTRADLRYANFKRANLTTCVFANADARRAYFRNARLRRANLAHADFTDADLCYTDLSLTILVETNLTGADLYAANLDFSCFPLWCGSLRAKANESLIIQLLYHTLSLVENSDVSQDLKQALLTDDLLRIANKVHHMYECRKIGSPHTPNT